MQTINDTKIRTVQDLILYQDKVLPKRFIRYTDEYGVDHDFVNRTALYMNMYDRFPEADTNRLMADIATLDHVGARLMRDGKLVAEVWSGQVPRIKSPERNPHKYLLIQEPYDIPVLCFAPTGDNGDVAGDLSLLLHGHAYVRATHGAARAWADEESGDLMGQTVIVATRGDDQTETPQSLEHSFEDFLEAGCFGIPTTFGYVPFQDDVATWLE